MKPVDFKEANRLLNKPASMAEKECGLLPVFTDGVQCISCWKPSLKERLYLLFRGKLWLSVRSGYRQPPVWLIASKTAFLEKK